MKLAADAVRLCHAVGLATRLRVGRWVSIEAALTHLAVADRAREVSLLEAAMAGGLVQVNPGETAHSISLTAAGLDLCRAATTPKA